MFCKNHEQPDACSYTLYQQAPYQRESSFGTSSWISETCVWHVASTDLYVSLIAMSCCWKWNETQCFFGNLSASCFELFFTCAMISFLGLDKCMWACLHKLNSSSIMNNTLISIWMWKNSNNKKKRKMQNTSKRWFLFWKGNACIWMLWVWDVP